MDPKDAMNPCATKSTSHSPETHNPRFFASLLLVALYVSTCFLFVIYYPEPEPDHLTRIYNRGHIIVISRNNAHCYYLYREEPMGFEYDLARAFADDLGVELKINIASSWEEMIPEMLANKGDLIAASLTRTPKRSKRVAFGPGYFSARQVMIVHRSNTTIRKLADLAGRTVDVRAGTSYEENLEKLRQGGLDVTIRRHRNLPTEELIRQVAERKIEVTIADSHIAMLNRRYFPHAIIVGAVSEEQQLGWALPPDSRKLRSALRRFIGKIQKDGTLAEIRQRYFANVEEFDFVDLRAYHRRLRTRLPAFKGDIEKAAAQHGLDWRLIAAQMYQESHFDPTAVSRVGALGLMQLTLRTANALGVADPMEPAGNIAAGVRHLRKLFDHYDQYEGWDRIYVAMAAYNVGQGHIFDARELARKRGLDPNLWTSLKETLPLLQYQRYYKDAKYGYCRGAAPVKYVRQIGIYYDILKRQGIRYQANLASPPAENAAAAVR